VECHSELELLMVLLGSITFFACPRSHDCTTTVAIGMAVMLFVYVVNQKVN